MTDPLSQLDDEWVADAEQTAEGCLWLFFAVLVLGIAAAVSQCAPTSDPKPPRNPTESVLHTTPHPKGIEHDR